MIKAEIYNQKIKLNCESVASDSVKYLKIKFFLDDDWEGTTKTAVFANVEQNITVSVILEEGNPLYLGDNTCYVPYEVIKPPFFSVNISGLKNDSVITTLPESIRVYQSGDISAESCGVYTPSQYEQLVSIYEETKEIAQSVRNDADNGVFKGENGEDGKDAVIDNVYNPESENAQSGKAVAEAVDELKKYTDGNFATAIRETAIGNVVKVSDVSPIEHDLKVKVKSKNLLPYPYTAVLPQTIDGITFTDNGDGGIGVKGTLKPYTESTTIPYLELAKLTLPAGKYQGASKTTGDIILSGCMTSINKSAGAYADLTTETEVSAGIILMKSSTAAEVDMVIYPKIYKNEGTIETYTSQIIESVTVSRYGKNLFDNTYLSSVGFYGHVFGINMNIKYKNEALEVSTKTGDGSKRIQMLLPIEQFMKGETYTFSLNSTISPSNISIGRANDQNDTSSFSVFGSANHLKYCSFTVADLSKPYLNIFIYFDTAPTNTVITVKDIQIEFGTVATEYEPYIEPQTATASADGTVYGLTSVSPSMTMIADDGVILECEYNVDTKAYIDKKFAELK